LLYPAILIGKLPVWAKPFGQPWQAGLLKQRKEKPYSYNPAARTHENVADLH
jgi:hypothetical protein